MEKFPTCHDTQQQVVHQMEWQTLLESCTHANHLLVSFAFFSSTTLTFCIRWKSADTLLCFAKNSLISVKLINVLSINTIHKIKATEKQTWALELFGRFNSSILTKNDPLPINCRTIDSNLSSGISAPCWSKMSASISSQSSKWKCSNAKMEFSIQTNL